MVSVSVSVPKGKLTHVFASGFTPIVCLSELIKNASDACIHENGYIRVFIEEDEKRIRVVDNGKGFSEEEILRLGRPTESSKMVDGNRTSAIGEFYAGSKGQGIFTVFNLCERLTIKTFSHDDQVSYSIEMGKETDKLDYVKVAEEYSETEVILDNVSDETFMMLAEQDEQQKLEASTALYFEKIGELIRPEFYYNGRSILAGSGNSFEAYYQKNKSNFGRKNGYFVAKARFRFQNNQLTISYQDNAGGIFNFDDVTIDLSSETDLIRFCSQRGVKLLKSKDVYEILAKFSNEKVDAFSGVFYVGHQVRPTDLSFVPGVKVYVNNYGLYHYLNVKNDWLGLSQVSQNRKATSYKLKQTYGYVHFEQFDETESSLKISTDRNTFMGNLAFKKFEFLMRDVITNLFTSLDIETRMRGNAVVFEDKPVNRNLYVGEAFSFKELIKVSSHLSLYNIQIEMSHEEIDIDIDSGQITISKTGDYSLDFEYGSDKISKQIRVVEREPYFELVKKSKRFVYGTTPDLTDLIKKQSLKNLTLEEIVISSPKAQINKGTRLSPQTRPDKYSIIFSVEKYGQIIEEQTTVEVYEPEDHKVTKLKNTFPICSWNSKVNDIINGIAENYQKNPIFAGMAIRLLVEASLKLFIKEFGSDAEIEQLRNRQNGFDPETKMNALFNKVGDRSVDVNTRVLNGSGEDALKSRRKILNAYKKIEANDLIHSHDSSITADQVLQTMSVLRPMIKFVIEAVNAKHSID